MIIPSEELFEKLGEDLRADFLKKLGIAPPDIDMNQTKALIKKLKSDGEWNNISEKLLEMNEMASDRGIDRILNYAEAKGEKIEGDVFKMHNNHISRVAFLFINHKDAYTPTHYWDMLIDIANEFLLEEMDGIDLQFFTKEKLLKIEKLVKDFLGKSFMGGFCKASIIQDEILNAICIEVAYSGHLNEREQITEGQVSPVKSVGREVEKMYFILHLDSKRIGIKIPIFKHTKKKLLMEMFASTILEKNPHSLLETTIFLHDLFDDNFLRREILAKHSHLKLVRLKSAKFIRYTFGKRKKEEMNYNVGDGIDCNDIYRMIDDHRNLNKHIWDIAEAQIQFSFDKPKGTKFTMTLKTPNQLEYKTKNRLVAACRDYITESGLMMGEWRRSLDSLLHQLAEHDGESFELVSLENNDLQAFFEKEKIMLPAKASKDFIQCPNFEYCHGNGQVKLIDDKYFVDCPECRELVDAGDVFFDIWEFDIAQFLEYIAKKLEINTPKMIKKESVNNWYLGKKANVNIWFSASASTAEGLILVPISNESAKNFNILSLDQILSQTKSEIDVKKELFDETLESLILDSPFANNERRIVLSLDKQIYYLPKRKEIWRGRLLCEQFNAIEDKIFYLVLSQTYKPKSAACKFEKIHSELNTENEMRYAKKTLGVKISEVKSKLKKIEPDEEILFGDIPSGFRINPNYCPKHM